MLLAMRAELRPQLDDRSVIVEDTTFGEHMHQRCGHALADRVAEERCVGCDRTPSCRGGDAGDGVNHQLAVLIHRDLLTPPGSRLDQVIESFRDLLLNVAHDRSPP
jgi:hypothetical protein